MTRKWMYGFVVLRTSRVAPTLSYFKFPQGVGYFAHICAKIVEWDLQAFCPYFGILESYGF